MISESKIISIVFLLTIIVISIFLSFVFDLSKRNREFFDNNGSSYTASLLSSLGPIIYDSSTLSSDKIASLQKLNPPITDSNITSYLNSAGDPDGIIANIKTYLGSCPSQKNLS
jgi:hypothetical protein